MHVLLAGLAGLLAGPWLHHLAVQAGDDLPFSREAARCRRCGAAISPLGACPDCGLGRARPLILSILTGAAAAWIAAALGGVWVTVAYVYLVGFLAVLFVTDIDHKRIPNRITYPGTPIGLGLLAGGAFLDGTAAFLPRALLGALAFAAFFLAVFLIARGGLGFGDVKLAVPLGLFCGFLGWDRLFLAGLATAAIGGLVAVAALIGGRAGLKAEIPYGPPMILGGLIAVGWGDVLVRFL